MKTTARGIRRFVASFLFAMAAVCLFAAPTLAGVDADFNGDGILDRVILPRPPETNIVVRLSGGARQVLRLSDRVISVVAADIDHDGAIDLSALSERRGVFVWLNKGKAARGHLKVVKRKHRSQGFSLSTRGPLASAPRSSPEGAGIAGTDDDQDRLAQTDYVSHEFNPQPNLEDLAQTVPSLSDKRGGAAPSRAPPAPR